MPPESSRQGGLDLVGGGGGDDRVRVRRVAQPAAHVGEEDDLVGAQGARHRGRGVVRVDVVRAPVAVRADGGDDRDVVRRDVAHDVDVDALDPADVADVLAARPLHGGDAEEQAVVAAQPDGRLPVAAQAQDDVLVHLADEDHLGHLDGLGVAHPQAADELHGHVEPLHVVRDLRPAAVDDDRVHPDVLEEHDVAGEVLAQRRVGHGRAAVLDHHRAAVELADVGERLEQHARAGRPALREAARPAVAHVV